MGRTRIHESGKERVKVHRKRKVQQSSENKTFCDVCDDFIYCGNSEKVSRSLSAHRSSSMKHRNRLKLRNEEEGSQSEMVMENEEEQVMEDEEELITHLEYSNRSSIEALDVDDTVVSSDNMERDDEESVGEALPDISEYILGNTYLEYGRKTLLDLVDSSILDIQKQLLKGFDKIVEGKSPYEFSKVKGREVDWLTALEVTRDFMDGNDSILEGNNRLNTMNNSMRRETGRNSRLPKRMDTIVNAFCDNLGKKGSLREWKGSFFDDFLDAEKKKKMKIDGVKWTPLKGHFIPLESAIAQMLLRLKVEDFDSRVGPCYKEFPTSGGNVESIRVYNAFNSSKYAIDLQKWVNVLCLESFCKPLVLYLAIWVDKSPLNSSMTRKATPVMMFIMNDKTRTPYRIGFAPDDFGNNADFLEALLKKQSVSKAAGVLTDVVKDYKRQGLIDYLTFACKDFLEEVVACKGMDVQVGVGENKAFFRVFPVVSHFITDNMQAIELCSVNKEHCRMCQPTAGIDFSFFPIGNDRWRKRDIEQHKDVLANSWKNDILKIKNIASGHNITSFSLEARRNISKYQDLHQKLGCVNNNNSLFQLSEPFQDVPGV